MNCAEKRHLASPQTVVCPRFARTVVRPRPAERLLQWSAAKKGEPMSVAKIIELVASSDKSWDDAVRNAVAEAAKTVRGIRGVDVQDWTARVEGGRIVEYKANVKVAFGVEDE